MSISGTELREAVAKGVTAGDKALIVDLADARDNYRAAGLVPASGARDTGGAGQLASHGGGVGIHGPDLDEDISVESLLAGRRSGETQASLRRWLPARKGG